MTWVLKIVLRSIVWVFVVLVAVVALLALNLRAIVESEALRTAVGDFVARQDLELRSGQFRWSDDGDLQLEDLVVAVPGQPSAFFSCPAIKLGLLVNEPTSDAAERGHFWSGALTSRELFSVHLQSPRLDSGAFPAPPSSEQADLSEITVPPVVVLPWWFSWVRVEVQDATFTWRDAAALNSANSLEGSFNASIGALAPGRWGAAVELSDGSGRVASGALSEVVGRGTFSAQMGIHQLLEPRTLTSWEVELNDIGLVTRGLTYKAASIVLVVTGADGLELRFRGFSFQDEAFSRVAEGGNGRVVLAWPLKDASAALGDDAWHSKLQLELSAGGLLLDAFYLDLAEAPLRVEADWGSSEGRLVLHDGAVRLGKLLSLTQGRGWLDRKHPGSDWELQGSLQVHQADRAFELFVRDPLGETFPMLDAAAFDGAFQLEARAVKQANVLTDARVVFRTTGPEGITVSLADEASAERVHARLPLTLLGKGLPAERAGEAFLKVGSLELLGEKLPAWQLDFEVEGSRLKARRPLDLQLWGGHLVFSELLVSTALKTELRAESELRVENLLLDDLARSFGGVPIGGSLDGVLTSLSLRGEDLLSSGTLTAEIFGGQLELTDPGAVGLYGRVPQYQLGAARVSNWNLDLLIDELPLGRVSGVLDGTIEDLAVADGQPLRMRANFSTRSVRGVPQVISVKAISQLSILGGGGSDPFSRGVLSFFDEYRYAKFGLRCTLENDRFVLRGVEERDGKDYLVVGSMLPPSVNVISHNQVISFAEMVRRLSSALTAEETSEDAPEVGRP